MMSLPELLLAVLRDPNVAYLLFLIGIVGVVGEAYHPGTLLPGITGVIALILALVAFTMLPVNWLGVLLVLVSVGLFLAEAHSPGIGLLGAGGVVVFLLGSLLLFVPFSGPFAAAALLTISPILVVAGAAGMAAFFLLLIRASLATRRLPAVSGPEALLGKEGVATSELAPRGVVRVAGEDWTAIAEAAPISQGEMVEVIGVEGVMLRVHRPHEWPRPSIPSE
jgi:membrane-bound serine protease (ClpP class)